jgi:hypothetical protein
MAWEAFSQAEFNEFQSLTLRTLVGAGLRMRLYQGDQDTLYFGAGSFYEDEEVKDDLDQGNGRGNFYLSLRKFIGEDVETVMVGYYQPSFKRVNDYRVQLTAGIETKITQALQLVNSLSYARDSQPPQGIEEVTSRTMYFLILITKSIRFFRLILVSSGCVLANENRSSPRLEL